MSSADEDDLDVEIGGGAVDGGGDNQDDPDDGKTPEEVLEELKKTRAALARANKQAERARKTAKPAARKSVEKSDAAPVDESASEAAETRFRAAAIRAAGAAAILEAGFQGNRRAAGMLTRLLDHDDLDVTDDGDVDGLDDAVAELKEQYPGLFASGAEPERAGRRRPGSVDAAAGRREARKARAEPSKNSAVTLGRILRGGR